MLMANLKAVLQRPKVSASYARNAFDRSFSPKIHYQLGGLTPFMAEPVIAGSHFKLNRSIFQRTAAVNTAAFPKVDTHVEFFYVPIRLLWSYWNDFKLNIQDYNSSYMANVASDGTVTPHNPFNVPEINVAYIQNEIAGWLNGHFTSLSPSTHFTVKSHAMGANRLLDGLGYGVTFASSPWIDPNDPNATPINNFTCNAFKLLAYQKVYYDHFRNTAYESNDPYAYNADTYTFNGNFSTAVVSKFLTYRYVNYRKDYFQSIYPALNYVSSAPNGLSWTISGSVMSQGRLIGSSQGGVKAENADGGSTELFSPLYTAGNVNLTITTVNQVRAAFALDKLLRASSFAPKHVKDQFEARYGVKGVESGNESVRIGAFMNDIIFQEVTNVADTSNNLGEIGGKGVGYTGYGKDVEFTAKEDGIVLGLIYSMPRSSYDSERIDKWNTKLIREDFFIPEYMDLGLQPVYKYEGRYQANSTTANDLLGYTDRYKEYKVGIDVNHGLFNNNKTLEDFVVHTNHNWFSSFTGNGVDASYFKVKPTDLDSIFVQSTAVDDWTTDKFITYLDVKFVVNQNMSVHGQPKLGGLG